MFDEEVTKTNLEAQAAHLLDEVHKAKKAIVDLKAEAMADLHDLDVDRLNEQAGFRAVEEKTKAIKLALAKADQEGLFSDDDDDDEDVFEDPMSPDEVEVSI